MEGDKDGIKISLSSLEISPRKSNNTEITISLSWKLIQKMTGLMRNSMIFTSPPKDNSTQPSMISKTTLKSMTLTKLMKI
jgi:hypothetical protein